MGGGEGCGHCWAEAWKVSEGCLGWRAAVGGWERLLGPEEGYRVGVLPWGVRGSPLDLPGPLIHRHTVHPRTPYLTPPIHCHPLNPTPPHTHTHPALQGGMVTAVLISALALSLPYFLVVYPVHLFRLVGRWVGWGVEGGGGDTGVGPRFE